MRANIKLWFTLIAVLLISMSVIWYFNKPIENLTNAEPDLGVDVGIKGLGGAFITPISIQGVPTAAEKREEIKKTEEKKESAEWIKQYTGWSQGGSATFFTEELKGDSSIGVYRIGASWRPTVSNVVDIEGTTENSSDSTPPDQVNEDTPTINIRAFYGGEANGAQISMDDLINITMILFQVEVKPVTTDLDLNRIIIESPRGQRNVLPWMETTTPGVWEAFGPVSPGVVTFQVSKRATVPMARATKTLTFEAGCDSGSYYEGGICVEQTSCGDKPVRTEGDMENPRVCCPDLPDAEKYMFDYSESGNRCKITCKDTNKYMDGSGDCVEWTTTVGNNYYLVRGTKGYAFLDEDGGLVDINAGTDATVEPCRDCPEGKYRANCGSFNEGTCVNRKECSEHSYIVDHSTTGQPDNNAQNICCPQLFFYGTGAQYTANTANTSQRCYFECDDGYYLRLKNATNPPTNPIPIADARNSFECVSQIPTLKPNEYYDMSTGDKGSGYFDINSDNSATHINLTLGSEYTSSTCPDCTGNSYRANCTGDSSGNCVSCGETSQVNKDGDGCEDCPQPLNASLVVSGNDIDFTYCQKTYKCYTGFKPNSNSEPTGCVQCDPPQNTTQDNSGTIEQCRKNYKCNPGYETNLGKNGCDECQQPANTIEDTDGQITKCRINYSCNPGFKTNSDSEPTGCVACQQPANTIEDTDGQITKCRIKYSCIDNAAVYITQNSSCESCLGFDVHNECSCSDDFGKYAQLNTAETAAEYEYKNTLKVGETLRAGQVLIGQNSPNGYRTYALALSSGALALYQFYQGLEGLNNNTKGALIWMKKADPSDPFTKLENPTSGQPYLRTKRGETVDFASATGDITVGIDPNTPKEGFFIISNEEGSPAVTTNIPIKIGGGGSVVVTNTPAFELNATAKKVEVIGIIYSDGGDCNILPDNYNALTVNEFNANRYSLKQVLECSPGAFVRLHYNNGNPNVFNNLSSTYGCQPKIVTSGSESVRGINGGCGTQKDQYVLVRTTFKRAEAIPLLNQLNQRGGIPKGALPNEGRIGSTNWYWASNLIVKWDSILSQVTWSSFKRRYPDWCKGVDPRTIVAAPITTPATTPTTTPAATRPLTQEEVREKIFEAGDAQRQREATWSRRSPTQLEQDKLRAQWCKAYPWDSYMGVPC